MNPQQPNTSRRRFVWVALALLALPVLLLPLSCSSPPPVWTEKAPVRVVVTIAPLASFVRAVGGDRVAIRSICTTSGPHGHPIDFRDARVLDEAHILFSIGLDLDNRFIDALYRMARRSDLPHIVLGDRLQSAGKILKMRQHVHAPRKPGEEPDESAHSHGEYDPHVWLGIDQSIFMVEVIRDELIAVDGEYEQQYRKNADAYIAKLRKLHSDGKELLKGKEVRIISFHDAFEYLAKSFNVKVVDVLEMTTGTNPSAFHLAKLEKCCQEQPIDAITVEPQYPDSTSARQLQKALKNRDISIPLVSIDPLETAERDELEREGGDWYLVRMRKNLEALAGVLK